MRIDPEKLYSIVQFSELTGWDNDKVRRAIISGELEGQKVHGAGYGKGGGWRLFGRVILSVIEKGLSVNPKFTAKCAYCGSEFRHSRNRRKFCSRKCEWADSHPGLWARPCIACGAEFKPSQTNQVYCSRKCGQKKHNSIRYSPRIDRSCKICNKMFKARQRQWFCSSECRYENILIKLRKKAQSGRLASGKKCAQCGFDMSGVKMKVYCTACAKQRRKEKKHDESVRRLRAAQERGRDETALRNIFGIAALSESLELNNGTYADLKQPTRQCKHCGSPFSPSSRYSQRYCCLGCREKARIIRKKSTSGFFKLISTAALAVVKKQNETTI